MNDHIDDSLADWFDDADAVSYRRLPAAKMRQDAADTPREISESIAESLIVHGLLADMGNRNCDHDAERIRAVMQRIDSEFESDSVNTGELPAPLGRRRFAMLTSGLTISAVVMLVFAVFGPNQSVSAAIASLEKVIEATAKTFDRTYSVRVVEEYPLVKQPQDLTQGTPDRGGKEQIDGATLYVRGANQYVMTVMLSSGLQRTSGCDGVQSWAFHKNGPVHVSADLNRFRGGLPGQQQGVPFINMHDHLSQLQTGYDVDLGDSKQNAADGTKLSQLIGVRKSRDVRGPKQVEIWFDAATGTIHKMLLDGLPRGRSGPKSVMLELLNQSHLDAEFFSHESHHEPGRRIRYEEEQQ